MTFTAQSQWSWNTSGGVPVVSGYPATVGGVVNPASPTKTGVMPCDLQKYVGVPLQLYTNPPVPLDGDSQLQFIRWAEDEIEQESGVLLCPTWVASPPAINTAEVNAIGLIPGSGWPGSVQGIGYGCDLLDAPYDFIFPRAQDEGWMYQLLRYKPVRQIANIAYIYPLLNEYFIVPPSWIVLDQDVGMVRLVPSTNVQMLPLFAMQLAFMGFAESVPGGLWYQYLAGLNANDYQSRYSFVKQLVLSKAASIALAVMQGTVNMGAKSYKINQDGIIYETTYDEKGAFNGLIDRHDKKAAKLSADLQNKIAMPVLGML